MRINKSHTIFFAAIAIMLLYLLEDRSPLSYKALSIHTKSSHNDVSKMFSMKGYKVYVDKEKYFERGNATFSLVKIEGMSTKCGSVNILISFFNNELASIKYVGFSNKSTDKKKCMSAIIENDAIDGSNITKEVLMENDGLHYDIIFSDDVIDRKMTKWAEKWS
ncbi:hypothetical protein [Klebsiella spallanzanii]|uniref:YdcD family protein n=1 Tax=Klebsiella spallanzanii TaxID=2587528 RepID=UPI0011583FBF|nr:hypothetical protein [Klebsiella spallanzanii]VUS31134.1 hypothetical protein SB6419_02212 [Klebsiella spallanzanii]